MQEIRLWQEEREKLMWLWQEERVEIKEKEIDKIIYTKL